MIVKKSSEGEVFSIAPRVKNILLLSGERIMFVLVELQEGSTVPMHSHPHEQMGLCLRGSANFQTENGTTTVGRGQAYLIPGNERHSVTNVSKGGAVFLDTFSPPREDYLAKAAQ